MVSPQVENGHLDLANELVDKLAKSYLSANESKILWAIWRKTYCWHKKSDWISFSQFRDMTGLADPHISRTLKRLIDRKIVTRIGKSISFNKHYDEWKELPKQVTNYLPKQVSGVTRIGNKKLPKQEDTKEKPKETITKETSLRDGASSQFGNQEINQILQHLREKMEIPKLDLSERVNRQYAYTLLKKSKTGLTGVKWLIDLAASDPWHKNHISSVRDLWNNQVKIIQNKRGEVNKYVDITSNER